MDEIREKNDKIGSDFVKHIANQAQDEAVREPKPFDSETIEMIEAALDRFSGIKKMIVETFDLPVEAPEEVNFVLWTKPYRIAKNLSHPALFLYKYKFEPGDASAFHASRSLVADVRPFQDWPFRVAQTVEAEIYTFYILPDANDILPDEEAEYTG